MEENTVSNYVSNQAFMNSNIIQMRLDTSELLQNIKMFLSGEVLTPVRKDDGTMFFTKQSIGSRRCNERGVQDLMLFVSGIVNSAVVQGNFKQESYDNLIERIHTSLTERMSEQWDNWGFQREDRPLIMDTIMTLLETFLSRIINNLERESYTTSLRSQETSRVDPGNNKIMSLFGGGRA